MNELVESGSRIAESEVVGDERRWGRGAFSEYPERLQEIAAGRRMSKKRILIVKNSLIQVAQLKELLQGRGYWVTVAANGQEALTAEREHEPDLVITTYDSAVQQNRKLIQTQSELQELSEELHQEIAERRKAKEEIRRLKDFNEGIVQNMAEGIAVEDAEGNIIFVNPAATDLLGYSDEELVGQHWTTIVPPDQHPSARVAHERRMQGEPHHYELQLVRKDGTLIPVLVSASPLIKEGRFAGTLSVFTDITEHKQVEEELQQSLKRLRRTFEETVNALVTAVRIKDPYTAAQQRRVTQLATAIAREMDLPEKQIEGIRVAATVYDIGKIHVPAEFFLDVDGLTELEYGVIKAHPQIGYDILKRVEFPWPVAETVFQHHERMDGSGYPQGLSGEEILLEARIVAVADVVVAMASHQPYRAARGIDRALEEVSQNRWTLYDPEVVGACLKLFRKRGFRFEQEEKDRDMLWQTP